MSSGPHDLHALTETLPGAAPPTPRDIVDDSHGALGARYQLGGVIGRGGMGEVMVATDRQIGREVAIKRIRDGLQTDDRHRRFLREAQIQGGLEHPAIVPVHELSTDDAGRPYFVMKKLAGDTLADVLTRTPPPPRQRLLRAFTDVCLAIELAHTRGVIHRDLKPANIMLGDFGEVYVLDWGVARVRDDGRDPARPAIDSASDAPADLTATGALLGTPGYMAPEQIRGDAALDHRADLYALGAILFEILTGAPLHPPGTLALHTTLAGIETRPSARAPELAIGPELDAIVARACAMDPDDRFASARELADQVTAYLDGDRDVAARKQLAAAHLARARAALLPAHAIDDPVARRLALREASSAFALDPTADEASRIVTRLMLAPPRETPAEVEAALTALDTDTARRQARLGTGAILGYLGFLPILYFIGIRDLGYLAAYIGLVVASAATTWRLSRAAAIRWPIITAVVLGQAALVALYARIFSPFLIAPGVAGATLMAFAQHPRWGRVGVLWAAMTAAVLVPYLLERAGVLVTTMRFVGDTLVLRSPALLVHARATELGLSIYVPTMLFVCVFFARQNSRAQREAQRLLEIQKWQLRQLMPTP
jgi:eukaryotic-like serine/threonine-protein kinase